MSDYPKTKQNRVVRAPKRGHYDQETVYGILDEAMLCHVGMAEDEGPVVIPTLHARKGNQLLLHGATTSRLIKYVAAGRPVCITVSLIDGLVLARSVFHHSINYRSAVLFGRGVCVPDEEKMDALARFTERLIPGRWEDARQPSDVELKATAVVAIPIDLASAKIRVGPPHDDAADMSLPVWAGVVPVRRQYLAPEADPALMAGIAVPDYIQTFVAENG